VGASGVGKSTLLHILGTLDRPTSGKVYFGGVDIFQLKDHELAEFRNRNIGFLFQFHHLLGEFTALENVMMPLLIGRVGKEEAARDAKGILEAVGLGARFSHKPGELSGGEQQRVAIARALVHHPDLVLADEPTGNLDSQTSASIYELLRRLNEERGQTFIIVTHNSHLADQMDRVIRLVDGKVYQEP
jgi:lipoprotein-releasing system ATP-binding protein